VEAILIDIGADRRDLGDLVPDRIRILAFEPGTAAAAPGRLDLECFADLMGRDERAGVSLVTGLPSAFPPRRRGGRPALDLDGGRVG
jgi:hypothetical protein